MTPVQQLEAIFAYVRKNGKYVERDYKTIGGMWIVDTWVLNDIKVQLMDEGSTQAVIADGLNAHSTCGRPVNYSQGTEVEITAVYESLK